MAPGVDRALHDLRGKARVEQLRQQGRYRRDVY
jgi:sulfite reductase (NADPH) flavoprotein alpha-component